MMAGPLAVIDLGTNTFHLLIAEPAGTRGFRFLHRHRRYVHLGRAGLEVLDPAAMQAGLDACRHFRSQMEQFGVSHCRALGTEALRRASNADEFTARISEILGQPVERVDGLEEARLIARGVSLLMPKRFPPALIMDIGGGSVEFIRMEQGAMRWRGSYPCGVSVLRRGHHRTEPLSATAIAGLETYLDEVLSPLLSNQAGLEVPALIGAAGIYEVLARHTATGYRGGLRTIDLEVFHCFAKEVIPMDLDQRVAHPSVPRERAELFPVALILIRWVLKQLAVSQLLASPYALKEGALAEMIAE